MRAKGVDFEVTYINLREKPDWFLEISPHGKVPVLKVGDIALFESSAIAEYLDEVVAPRLHPEDPIERARHRAWTDYVPTFSALLSGVYYCDDADQLPELMNKARVGLGRLEGALAIMQPQGARYFAGNELCLVDAAYAPFFQRFALVDGKLQTGLLIDFPRVAAWANALLATDAVNGSVADSFEDEYVQALVRREAHAAQFFKAA
ncbi:MAG: glutathione S-transferase [Gammaproteobacteria bacterium]|jgi:glutathione S-transferase